MNTTAFIEDNALKVVIGDERHVTTLAVATKSYAGWRWHSPFGRYGRARFHTSDEALRAAGRSLGYRVSR